MRSSKHTEERVARSVPFSSFQYVDVEFGAADEDVVIEHQLNASTPDEIRWEVVSIDAAGVVYRSPAATRRSWTSSYILLRCSAANANTRLRLSVEP